MILYQYFFLIFYWHFEQSICRVKDFIQCLFWKCNHIMSNHAIQPAMPVRAQRQHEYFAKEILHMIDGSGIDVGRIWFTYEDYFHLDGVVNKHNWRFWSTENPYLSHARPLHCTTTQNLQIGLQSAAEASFDLVSCDKRWRLTVIVGWLAALHYSTVKGKGMDWRPYSTDLITCKYFLWGTLKDILPQQSFNTQRCTGGYLLNLRNIYSHLVPSYGDQSEDFNMTMI